MYDEVYSFQWKVLLCLALPIYLIARMVYNIYIHPLRSYKGPWLARATSIPWIFYQVRGRLPHVLKAWHDKYGTTIRVAPNTLSYTDSQAWFDIHRHKTSEKGSFERDPKVYPDLPGRAPSILLSNQEDHARFRRSLSHAFSEQELRNQERTVQSYTELFVTQLKRQIDKSQPETINISSWLNFVTFDIIGDLAFGESFGCLESGKIHPWVEIIFSSVRDIVYLAALSHLPKPLFVLIRHIIAWFMMEDLEKDRKFSADRVDRRLKLGATRNDFMTPILKRQGEKAMTLPEIYSSFNILVVAGSETSATLLSGVLYTLAMNPRSKEKLVAELDLHFRSTRDISMAKLQSLEYLNAVLNEGLRIYPPSAFNQARIVPDGGASICGKFVPAGTAVGVATWAASRSNQNWRQPQDFIPERWIGDGFPEDDRRSAQPFILGPRVCLGKNLAYVEMRHILATFLHEFDYELHENSQDWIVNQRFFLLWERPPLMLKLARRKRLT